MVVVAVVVVAVARQSRWVNLINRSKFKVLFFWWGLRAAITLVKASGLRVRINIVKTFPKSKVVQAARVSFRKRPVGRPVRGMVHSEQWIRDIARRLRNTTTCSSLFIGFRLSLSFSSLFFCLPFCLLV